MIDIINTWLAEAKNELIANYVKTGVIASGQYGKELETKSEQTSTGYRATILGSFHSQFMESGRGPNKNQEPESIRKFVGFAGSTFIDKWVKDKGLNINPFAVAYKIARVGYKGHEGIITDVINEERINSLLIMINNAFISNIKTDLQIELSK